MKSRRNSALEEASVDMSPMIDMTFLLLIFFIVNMNFTKETGIEVKRPTAATGEAKTGDVIMVGISSAGTIHMNGKRIDLSNVRPTVSQARNKTPSRLTDMHLPPQGVRCSRRESRRCPRWPSE